MFTEHDKQISPNITNQRYQHHHQIALSPTHIINSTNKITNISTQHHQCHQRTSRQHDRQFLYPLPSGNGGRRGNADPVLFRTNHNRQVLTLCWDGLQVRHRTQKGCRFFSVRGNGGVVPAIALIFMSPAPPAKCTACTRGSRMPHRLDNKKWTAQMDAETVGEWKDRYIDFRALAKCPANQYQVTTGGALWDMAGASPPGSPKHYWGEAVDYVTEHSPLLAERLAKKHSSLRHRAQRRAMQQLLEDEVRKVNEWAEQQLRKFSAAVKNLERYSHHYKGMPARHQVCCHSGACRSVVATVVAAIVAHADATRPRWQRLRSHFELSLLWEPQYVRLCSPFGSRDPETVRIM